MLTKTLIISIIYALAIILAACYCKYLPLNPKHADKIVNTKSIFYIELLIFFVSLFINLQCSILSPLGDSAAFDRIIKGLVEEPFLGFYTKGGIYYPPLFNYIFWVIGKIIKAFGIPFAYTNRYFVFMMKTPGILCEFLAAFILYKFTKKKFGETRTIPVLLLTLLNPGYIFATSYISQVDAVYSFFMLLTVYFIVEEKIKLSYFLFACAIMTKFQAVFITPVIFFATYKHVFMKDFNWKKFWTHLVAGLASILYMGILYIPFVIDFSTMSFVKNGGAGDNFSNSIKSFGLATQNTYNFWCLMGYNYVTEDAYFGPFTCKQWGYSFIVILVIITLILFILRRKDSTMDVMPLLGATLVSGMICFSIRMMPRYLYPAIGLLILAWIIRPNIKRLICVISFSVAFFIELVFEYIIYHRHLYKYEYIAPNVLCVFMLLCFGFLIYTILTEKKDKIYTHTTR